MTERKIQNIQALRGVAVLLVLARHLQVMERNCGGGLIMVPEIFRAGDGGVDLFFVISGFIMVVITRGRFQQPGEFGAFLYRRATRIFPLYWLFSFAILLVFLVVPAWVPPMQKGQVDLFASFLLLPQLNLPLLGPGWTLEHEAYFYVVFAGALWLPEKWLSNFLVLWGLAVAAGGMVYNASPDLLDHATLKLITNPITIEFVLGACVALAVDRGWRRGDWLCLVGGALLLPASTLFFDPLDVEGLRFFCYGLPSVVLVYGAVSLEYRSQFQFPQWLRSLGDASFSIYLSHLLIIEVLGRFWKAFHPANPWVHVGMLLLMTAAALTGGFAVHRWLEEPLLRICHRWQPRRPSASLSTDASVVAK